MLSVGGEQIHWDQLLETSDGSPSSIWPSCVVGRCGKTTNLVWGGGVLQEGAWRFWACAYVSISPCTTRNISLPRLVREFSHCPQCCKVELQVVMKYLSWRKGCLWLCCQEVTQKADVLPGGRKNPPKTQALKMKENQKKTARRAQESGESHSPILDIVPVGRQVLWWDLISFYTLA